ncbi:MAG: hypothetical protein RLT87_06975 [Gammaproteobacteria bacterium]
MKQNINLYQPELREQKIVFSAASMLLFTGLFLLLFAAASGYQLYQVQPYEKQISKLEAELMQLQQQVTALEASQAKDKSKLLENEIARITREIERQERIKETLSSRSFGNDSGFSDYLASFARGHVEGTWLTKVTIKAGGSLLGLTGKTLSSELVPLYLQNLASEEALRGASFNVLEIARVESKDGGSEINFLISTN